MRRWVWLTGLVLAVTVAAASCSTSGGKVAESAPPLTAALGNGTMTKNFNPFSPTVGIPDGGINFIYEPLIVSNVVNPGQVYPWLAKSYAWSNHGKTLTFRIRDGVKWTDGKPLTSADVAFTFDLLLKHPQMNLSGATFKAVSAPNPSTVVLSFPEPAYMELFYLSGIPIISKARWSSVKDPVTFLNPNPVGTGPFTIKQFSSQRVTFVKNPHYWQPGKPKVPSIQLTTYTSNNGAMNALTSGKADWGQQFFPQLHSQWLTKPTRHFYAPSVGMNSLYLNLTKYPLNKVAVRQAISYAIDRRAVSAQGESGVYPPATSPTGLSLPNQQKYLAPQYKDLKLSYDRNKAKSLLASAGFHPGSGGMLEDSSGHKLSLTLDEWGNSADYMASAQIIANELKQVGIGVNIKTESGQSWGQITGNGQFDMTILWSQIGPGPYYMYDGWLDSKYYKPIGTYASNDIGRFKNATADRLLNQISTSPADSTAQMKAYYGLEKIMVEQMPTIPLFNLTKLCAYTTDHYVGWPSDSNPYSQCVALDLKTAVTIRPKSGT